MKLVPAVFGVVSVLTTLVVGPVGAQEVTSPRKLDAFTPTNAIRDSAGLTGGTTPGAASTTIIVEAPKESTAPATIYATCSFSAKAGTGTTVAEKHYDGSCYQGGMFSSGTTSTTVTATMRAGDGYTGTSGASGYSVTLSDENAFSFSWSGDCTGTSYSCTTAAKTASWRGLGAEWSATVTVTEKATGNVTSKTVSATYSPCGVYGKYECP